MKNLLSVLLCAFLISSCTIQSTFTLKSDKSGSFMTSFTFHKALLEKAKNSPSKKDYSDLPKGWVNMYEHLKAKNDSVSKPSTDSLENFKKMDIRYTVVDNQLTGIDIRMDSVPAGQWDSYSRALNYMNNEGSIGKTKDGASTYKSPFSWDGSILTIYAGKSMKEGIDKSMGELFPKPTAKDKKENEEMFKFFKNMFGDSDIEIVYTFVLEKKISSIKGKNDFIKKLNDHTIEMRIKMMETLDKEMKGKKAKRQDETIIVNTK